MPANPDPASTGDHTLALGSDARKLSAVFTGARSTPCGAVLLLYPFLEERKTTHRAFVELADKLAEMGISSLRVDLPGSGDSPGEFTLADWRKCIGDAYRWLQQTTRHHPALIGMRGGALLALDICEELNPSAIITWALPASGERLVRDYLQRKMVNEMMMFGQGRTRRSDLKQALAKGETVDLDGHPLPAELYLQLQQLKGGSTPPPKNSTPLLCVHIGAGAPQLPDWPKTSQLEFTDIPPFWNRVGLCDTSDPAEKSAAWLKEHLPSSPKTPAISSEHHDKSLAENQTLTDITTPGGTIRAVMQHAEGDARGQILMLHGWAGNRCGPHNIFKHASEQWVQRGYNCLRIDFRGRGDSSGDSDKATIQTMADDAQYALKWLQGESPSSGPIILVAICSGCKVALTLASREPSIKHLLLLSAEAMGHLRAGDTNRRKSMAALVTYARKLLRPATWHKIITGRVQTDMVRKAVASHETRSQSEAVVEDKTLSQLAESSSLRALLIYGGSDPDTTRALPAYTKWFKKNNFTTEQHIIADANHSYYSIKWEQELLDVATNWMTTSCTREEQ